MNFKGIESCGNAPKKNVLEQLIVAMVTENRSYLENRFVSDVEWTFVGKKVYKGIENLEDALKELPICHEVTIETVITHGRNGAVNGVLICKERKIGFSHIFQFASAGKQAKLTKITTYLITLGESND